jgi:hypothetical protein
MATDAERLEERMQFALDCMDLGLSKRQIARQISEKFHVTTGTGQRDIWRAQEYLKRHYPVDLAGLKLQLGARFQHLGLKAEKAGEIASAIAAGKALADLYDLKNVSTSDLLSDHDMITMGCEALINGIELNPKFAALPEMGELVRKIDQGRQKIGRSSLGSVEFEKEGEEL